MALEPRRDQPVRLPNPSAQPFVVALKTARFYAVVLFWVTMVCVLAHVTTFILAEWVALYDLPQAGPAAPEPAEVKPATEPAKEPAPADTSGFGIFENSALAAPAKSAPGELFPGVPFEGGAKKPGTPAEPTKPPKEPAKTTPAEMPKEPPSGAATEGKVVGQPEVRPKEVEPLTPAERRQKVMHYRNVTADILRPARIVGVLASFLLAVTVFLYLQIALLGRLSGIRQLTNALFLLLVFLVTILPWESIFEGFRAGSLLDFAELLEAHAAHARGWSDGRWPMAQYFGRYLVMPIASAALLAWSGIQFAAGYAESVLANE